jgi:hypothetical protein
MLLKGKSKKKLKTIKCVFLSAFSMQIMEGNNIYNIRHKDLEKYVHKKVSF